MEYSIQEKHVMMGTTHLMMDVAQPVRLNILDVNLLIECVHTRLMQMVLYVLQFESFVLTPILNVEMVI